MLHPIRSSWYQVEVKLRETVIHMYVSSGINLDLIVVKDIWKENVSDWNVIRVDSMAIMFILMSILFSTILDWNAQDLICRLNQYKEKDTLLKPKDCSIERSFQFYKLMTITVSCYEHFFVNPLAFLLFHIYCW